MGGKRSAGLLMYRHRDRGLEVFLVHPGGPFFSRKDAGAWSVPKGEIDEGEDPLAVARREFEEETGRGVEACAKPDAELVPLGSVRQRGGKTVHAWAFEGDWPEGVEPSPNTFEIEWPPRSGRRREFPEIDRAEFFTLDAAREKIHPAQAAFLDRLSERRGGARGRPSGARSR